MDDLDLEIEEAARAARRRVWRGRLATIASTATLLIVGVVGSIVVLKVFPEPDVSEFEFHRQEMKARNEEPGAMMLVDDYAAQSRDRSRMRWKFAPVIAMALASALLVRKWLQREG